MVVARDNRSTLIHKQTRSRIESRVNVNIYSVDFHLICPMDTSDAGSYSKHLALCNTRQLWVDENLLR